MSKPAICRAPKTVAGLAMVAFGAFILHANFAAALAAVHQILAASCTVNLVPAVMLAALQNVQSGGSDHLVRGLLQHTLLMLRPLFLVIAGTLLSRPAVTGDLGFFSKKDF